MEFLKEKGRWGGAGWGVECRPPPPRAFGPPVPVLGTWGETPFLRALQRSPAKPALLCGLQAGAGALRCEWDRGRVTGSRDVMLRQGHSWGEGGLQETHGCQG